MKKLILLTMFLVSFGSYSSVEVISGSEGEYRVRVIDEIVLHSSQSIDYAKDLLITKAKSDSSNLIGGDVYTSLFLDGDVLTRDEVAIITSHFIKEEYANYTVRLDAKNKVVIELDAVLFVGDNSFKSEISRWSEFEMLKRENQRLKDNNEKLSKSVIDAYEGYSVKANSRRTAIEFENGKRQVFVDKMSHSKSIINAEFIRAFSDEISVDFGDIEVVEGEVGLFDVYVAFEWKSSVSKYKKALGKVFNVFGDVFRTSKGSVLIKKNDNDDRKIDSDLFNYLSSFEIKLIVETGKGFLEDNEVIISGIRMDDFEGEVYHAQLNKPFRSGASLSNGIKYLTFKDMPIEEVNKLRVIDYKILVE